MNKPTDSSIGSLYYFRAWTTNTIHFVLDQVVKWDYVKGQEYSRLLHTVPPAIHQGSSTHLASTMYIG